MSTWKGEDEDAIRKVENLGAEVVQNDMPKNTGNREVGWFNFDLQLKSTKEGFRLASELNCEYLLKTRSDQRFYRHDLLDFLFSLTETFPLHNNNSPQNQRLITSSLEYFQAFYLIELQIR